MDELHFEWDPDKAEINSMGGFTMLDEYDFSQSRPNPYAKRERKTVTMNLDEVAISYFKQLAAETGIPYQNLINLYLVQCAREHKQLMFS